MRWRIAEYRTEAGEAPMRIFVAGLPVDVKAEAIALIKLAETLTCSSPDTSSGSWEAW